MTGASPIPQSAQQNTPRFLNGLREIIDQYDHFILDIFGVIHDGIEPFPHTLATLKALKDASKQTCLLSNTPRRAEGAMQQMEYMGIPRDLYDHVVTSGEATHYALKERPDAFHEACGDDCWFIGPDSFDEVLEGLSIHMVDGPAEASFILNSIPGTESTLIEKLKNDLKTALDLNLPMICANPDLVVNIGSEQHECAGTFAKIYEDMGGKVLYHGKPHAPVYERCYELLDKPDKSRVLAIGDSLHTDIAGANGFGIDSVFNLVGIHWEEVQLDHAPGEADMDKITKLVNAGTQKPTYTTNGFSF